MGPITKPLHGALTHKGMQHAPAPDPLMPAAIASQPCQPCLAACAPQPPYRLAAIQLRSLLARCHVCMPLLAVPLSCST